MWPSFLRKLVVVGVFSAISVLPSIASAQAPPTPGETPEAQRPWTYYVTWLVTPLAAGVVLLIGLGYFRYSSRFFGKDEAPPQPRRRRVAPVAAASMNPPTAAPTPAAGPAVTPSRASAAAPAPTETSAPPAAEPASRPAPEHLEPDQETFDRVLKEQLDQGADRRVAEGRARAAGVRAARAKAAGGGGAEAEAPPKPEPQTTAEHPSKAEEEAKEEAEAQTEAGGQETEAAKEPEVPEPDRPEQEMKPEEPATVQAPKPQPEEKPEETPRPTVTATGDLDRETFQRVLDEQLAKGLALPIAEGRARAAAIKAAREKSDAG